MFKGLINFYNSHFCPLKYFTYAHKKNADETLLSVLRGSELPIQPNNKKSPRFNVNVFTLLLVGFEIVQIS